MTEDERAPRWWVIFTMVLDVLLLTCAILAVGQVADTLSRLFFSCICVGLMLLLVRDARKYWV